MGDALPARRSAHFVANVVLAWMAVGFGLLVTLVTLVRFALGQIDFELNDVMLLTPHELGYQFGQFLTAIWSLLGGLMTSTWAGVNALGMMAGRRWSRKSSIAMWAVTGVFCCALPISIYTIWALTRPEVKQAFDR